MSFPDPEPSSQLFQSLAIGRAMKEQDYAHKKC